MNIIMSEKMKEFIFLYNSGLPIIKAIETVQKQHDGMLKTELRPKKGNKDEQRK